MLVLEHIFLILLLQNRLDLISPHHPTILPWDIAKTWRQQKDNKEIDLKRYILKIFELKSFRI